MFNILTFKQLFENEAKPFYWRPVPLPQVYPSRNQVDVWINNNEDLKDNMIRFMAKDWDFKTNDYEIDPIEKVIVDMYEGEGYIYFVDENYKTYKIEGEEIEVKVNGERKFNKEDPYGEEVWENKRLNEIFDSNVTYEYKFVKSRKMVQFTDLVYTFTSKDNVEYFVTVSYNKDFHSMSVKFTDKANFKGLMNKVKDKYVDLENFDAINVLNTVVKICKDFYDKNMDKVKMFTTSTLDEKRLRVYKYILRKYFKGWEVDSYVDPRGDIVIEAEPPKEQVNEGWKFQLGELALFLTYLFSSIGSDVSHKRFTREYFDHYAKTMNIANNNQIVQMVVKDFKAKIATDPKIMNKQEVYNVIDNTPIVFRKNDEVCYILYNQARLNNPGITPSCWCTTMLKDGEKTKKGGKSVIFLAQNASYSDILHELSHAIETVVEVDPKILDMFNFNYTFKQQGLLYMMLTNFEYELKTPVNASTITYLKNPSEVYSRLNNLKMFLFKNGKLRSAGQEISEDLLYSLITGQVYKSLNEKAKEEYRKSDFMEILMFISVKKSRKINQYVQNVSQSRLKNNMA